MVEFQERDFRKGLTNTIVIMMCELVSSDLFSIVMLCKKKKLILRELRSILFVLDMDFLALIVPCWKEKLEQVLSVIAGCVYVR